MATASSPRTRWQTLCRPSTRWWADSPNRWSTKTPPKNTWREYFTWVLFNFCVHKTLLSATGYKTILSNLILCSVNIHVYSLFYRNRNRVYYNFLCEWNLDKNVDGQLNNYFVFQITSFYVHYFPTPTHCCFFLSVIWSQRFRWNFRLSFCWWQEVMPMTECYISSRHSGH